MFSFYRKTLNIDKCTSIPKVAQQSTLLTTARRYTSIAVVQSETPIRQFRNVAEIADECKRPVLLRSYM